jgi:hypothetical protein
MTADNQSSPARSSPASSSPGGRLLRKLAQRAVLALLAVVVLLWLGDEAVYRYRVARRTAQGTVVVNRYLAVPLKNGHLEFDPLGSMPQTCARALFPHGSDLPCWYLQRHRDQRSDL